MHASTPTSVTCTTAIANAPSRRVDCDSIDGVSPSTRRKLRQDATADVVAELCQGNKGAAERGNDSACQRGTVARVRRRQFEI